MKFRQKINLLLLQLLLCILCAGFEASALSYDYTASIECLEKPHKPQYSGGIVNNPELSQGSEGWSGFGNAKIELRESGGNQFLVAHSRSQTYDSMTQKIHMEKDKLYSFSAWIQVSDGTAPVTAVFKTSSGFQHAGAIVAESKCWSMLKGGLSPDASGFADLYFESKNTSIEIWVDSISIQPFTQEEWRSQQQQSIEKNHKSNVRIQAVDKQGKPMKNARVTIEQKRTWFPFGCAINKNILTNTAYQNWFTSRFGVTVFENEMKWYSNERSWGREDYSDADALLRFAKQHNIAVRGHNIFWDDPGHQPGWVSSLSPSDLSKAAERRVYSVVSRYKGQVIGWDVVNENLHFDFLESKLGQKASSLFFSRAHKYDGAARLFMNEYNTIEESGDWKATPAKYLQKLREIVQFPGNQRIPMGIGLESHFKTPNIPYMRASIDILAATGLPIWLTEVDVQSNNQAWHLEQILREARSHPKVQGIVMWSAWSPNGCYRMCLTDNNFRNLATGDVVDKLLKEWGSKTLEGNADADDGFFDATLFHGDYEVKINHQASTNFSISQSFKVSPTNSNQTTSMFLKVFV